MGKNNATYDVFIAYDHRDATTAKEVADILRSHGLTVFYDTEQIGLGKNLEDEMWEAMADSRALVAVLPEELNSSWLTFEIGAAKAWNKPLYAVSRYSAHHNLPVALQELQILPITRTDEIALSIIRATNPLTDRDIAELTDAYIATGLTADQLLLQPQQLTKLVKQFNRKSGRQLAGEEVMWNLLRLRKQGRLSMRERRNITKP